MKGVILAAVLMGGIQVEPFPEPRPLLLQVDPSAPCTAELDQRLVGDRTILEEELGRLLKNPARDLVGELDLWTDRVRGGLGGPSPYSFPNLALAYETLRGCIDERYPSLPVLAESGLPPLVVVLLRWHVQTEMLLRFLFPHMEELLPELLRQSFPYDQDYSFPEVVLLGVEYLGESSPAKDRFLLEEILSQVNPDDAFHRAIFHAGYMQLSVAGKAELQQGASRRTAFAHGESFQELMAATVDREVEYQVHGLLGLAADSEFQQDLRRILEAVGTGITDPVVLGDVSPNVRLFLWYRWQEAFARREALQVALNKLHDSRWQVGSEDLELLQESGVVGLDRVARATFATTVLSFLEGEGAASLGSRLVAEWAPEDRYLLGFAARQVGPAEMTERDLEILPEVDLKDSSLLHALILKVADGMARRGELGQGMARRVKGYLLGLGESDWEVLQEQEEAARGGMRVDLFSRRRGLVPHLYGALVTTRFRSTEEEYAAFLDRYLQLADAPVEPLP